MLKKCLKHDLHAIWRVWWILALIALGAGVLGTVSIRSTVELSTKTGTWPIFLKIASGLGIFASVLALGAFLVISLILIYVRYYKNFFSDEGYLTFSLPVRRSTLYVSKVIGTLIWNVATILLIVVIGIVALLCSGADVTFADVMNVLSLRLAEWSGGWAVVYLIEGVLFLLLAAFLKCGLYHFCITVGSVIAKKHKVLAAIGIYYAFSAVTAFAVEILSIFASIGAVSGAELLASLTETQYLPAVALLLLGGCAVIGAVGFLFHLITLGLIERKLNLA